jgi:hypothetical protein
MATQRDDRQRPLPSAQCSLCGIALPTGLLVPDGGQACADIRWYCQDARACTERWTANPSGPTHLAPTPPTPQTPQTPQTLTTPAAAREASPQPGEPEARRRA